MDVKRISSKSNVEVTESQPLFVPVETDESLLIGGGSGFDGLSSFMDRFRTLLRRTLWYQPGGYFSDNPHLPLSFIK